MKCSATNANIKAAEESYKDRTMKDREFDEALPGFAAKTGVPCTLVFESGQPNKLLDFLVVCGKGDAARYVRDQAGSLCGSSSHQAVMLKVEDYEPHNSALEVPPEFTITFNLPDADISGLRGDSAPLAAVTLSRQEADLFGCVFTTRYALAR